MSTLDDAKGRLEAALARLEACFAAIESAAAMPQGAAAPSDADLADGPVNIEQELAVLRAEQERLAADLAKSHSERETQKQIGRSVADALDIAIGRLDTILAE
jgi:Domain of unknown function (DUF4164)